MLCSESEEEGVEEEPPVTEKSESVEELGRLPEGLDNMNVHQLRKLARSTEGFPIKGREISRANRNELIEYFKKLG